VRIRPELASESRIALKHATMPKMTPAEKEKVAAELKDLDDQFQDLEDFLKTIQDKLDAMERKKVSLWDRVKNLFGSFGAN
jgi:chromosome segregation ATPase